MAMVMASSLESNLFREIVLAKDLAYNIAGSWGHRVKPGYLWYYWSGSTETDDFSSFPIFFKYINVTPRNISPSKMCST